MAPSEFWKLSTQEWFWEFDMKIAEQKRMTASTTKTGSNFSSAEWSAARKLHSEKMNHNA